MSDTRYEAWKRFCDESDKAVAEFKDEKGCPCCGHPGKARWRYNSDYDPKFIVECSNYNCECKVVSETSLEDAITKWNRRVPTKFPEVNAHRFDSFKDACMAFECEVGTTRIWDSFPVNADAEELKRFCEWLFEKRAENIEIFSNS